jgi:hypothetical protein
MTSEPMARHPRAEAQALLPSGLEARVLEPSPPAVRDGPHFADDPTDPAGASLPVVSPVSGTAHTWDEIAAERPGLERFVAEHWLGRRDRLPAIPDGYGPARQALHRVAYFVVAPGRFAATGKLGLRWTRGGFGTPFFGADEQVRVDGGFLVVQRGAGVRAEPLTTLRALTGLVGVGYRESWFEGFRDPLPPADPDAPLDIVPEAAAVVGDWFGFVTAVLEELRRTPGAAGVTRVQLWPEHFDPAVEMGRPGERASYGGSPGDASHPEPYLYVAPRVGVDAGPYWNDAAFGGASLPYAALSTASDPYGAAVEFLRRGHDLLSRR